MHTKEHLRELQSYPLDIKIKLTKQRIREWINEFGEDGVYVSFSGGKDSTVLLDIVRQDYASVTAVFCDTGLEFPEIRRFVKGFDNVVWLKPEKNFKQVINEYGYPFISKRVSKRIAAAQNYLLTFEELPENIEELFSMHSDAPANAKMLFGTLEHKENGVPTGEASKMYDFSRYKYFATAPFKVSDMCCYVFKKKPMNKYAKESGKKPITAQMTDEGELRLNRWLTYGCNAFNSTHPMSNPMSFWTEQDVLHYIKRYNLPIASVYGEIVPEEDGQLKGQMSLEDFGICDNCAPLKTTGEKRTGCVFCGYGCHREKPGEGRFERLKQTHPQIYDYIFKPTEDGGLGYKQVVDWINENNGKGTIIRY